MIVNGRPTINALTIGNVHPFFVAARMDSRAPVYSLPQEKINRCVIHADASRIVPGGSAVAESIEYSETMYGVAPNGGDTLNN